MVENYWAPGVSGYGGDANYRGVRNYNIGDGPRADPRDRRPERVEPRLRNVDGTYRTMCDPTDCVRVSKTVGSVGCCGCQCNCCAECRSGQLALEADSPFRTTATAPPFIAALKARHGRFGGSRSRRPDRGSGSRCHGRSESDRRVRVSFLRSARMWTSIVRSSTMASSPSATSINSARVNARPGCRTKARKQSELAGREIERHIAGGGPMPTSVDHDALADEDVAVAAALLASTEQGIDALKQVL